MRTATRSAAATAPSTPKADPKNANAPKATRKKRHRSNVEWGVPDEGEIAAIPSTMRRGQREVLQDWADAS